MEFVSFGDQELEAVLSVQEYTRPNLACPSKNLITLICTNPVCKESLCCSNPKCSTCWFRHEHCGDYLEHLSTITQGLNTLSKKKKECIEKVRQINNDFVEFVMATFQEFVNECSNEGLTKNNQKIMKMLYLEPEAWNISGKEAKQFKQNIFELNNHFGNISSKVYSDYSDGISKINKTIRQLKEQLHQHFNPTMDQHFDELQSVILKKQTQRNQKQFQFLNKSLNHPSAFKLLYRASEHNFDSTAFHKYCDDIEDTLVLVRTQFGKTIGGYTHYKWNQVPDNNFVINNDRNAFLVQLDLMEKMVPTNDDYLIYCCKQWGPVFGGPNLDLCIVDKCHLNRESFANFPTAYNSEGSDRYDSKQETFQIFCGAKEGNKFRVVEYEVFKVEYE